jgi:hypothetical protein
VPARFIYRRWWPFLKKIRFQNKVRQVFYTVVIAICFLSCGQKQTPTEKTGDTIKLIIERDTSENIKPNPVKENCSYENSVSDLGVGIVLAPTTFEIFEDSSLTKKHSTINMYEDENKIDFCSMFYKPDYGIMTFVVVGENTKSYKIMTGLTEYKFLPKTKEYEFKTWEKYILESLGVRRKIESEIKQQLKEQSTEDSKDLKIPEGHELFCPMEIKGDWIKVKYDCFYNAETSEYEGQPCNNYIDKCERPLTGWIKWRNQNELLIDIFLIP